MPKFNKTLLAIKLAKLHTAVFVALAHYVAAVGEYEDNVLATKAVREENEQVALKARNKLVMQMTKMRMTIQEFGQPGTTHAEIAGHKGLKSIYNGFREELLEMDADFQTARQIADTAN